MIRQECQVLFACTGNAGRSQIAEALFRRMAPEGVEVSSAGVAPWDHVHPVAARILAECGIDVSRNKPRHVRDAANQSFAVVVTIGGRARDETPDLPGQPVRIHWDLADPAEADGTPDSESTFRKTLAAVEARLPGLIEVLHECVPDVPPFAPGISTCIVRPPLFQPARHMPLIAKAGFACIELNCHQSERDFNWKSRDAVRELAAVGGDLGVTIRSVHAPGIYPLEHVDEVMGRTYVDTTKAFCDIAAELGARVVIIHAIKPTQEDPATREKFLRTLLEELADYVLPLPLILGWENLTRMVVPSEDLALIRSFSPAAMGFVLDNGHAYLHGTSNEYLTSCGLRLCSLHLQDSDAQKDAHWIPGMGTFDWKGFMERLVATGYTGPLMLEAEARDRQHELPGVLDDCMAAVRRLQSYLPKTVRP